ncbi:MAG: hypothetical protein ACE5D7_01650, partial [Fidelibacterota bacterium]
MKKVHIIGMVLLFLIGSLASGTDRKVASSNDNKKQFQIEAEQLKRDYAELEKQISQFYEDELRRLKEQRDAELEQLHNEMRTKYGDLQKKYGVEKSSPKDAQKNRETLKKGKNRKPVKDSPKQTRSVKRKKK